MHTMLYFISLISPFGKGCGPKQTGIPSIQEWIAPLIVIGLATLQMLKITVYGQTDRRRTIGDQKCSL